MSQLILDDQLDLDDVLPGIESWISWTRLQSLRPAQQILDDRVPEILLTLKRPTFVTIDHAFWSRKLCHSEYCILYFVLPSNQQTQLPGMLRRLLRLPEFATRSARMGKVVRIKKQTVFYWEQGRKLSVEMPP